MDLPREASSYSSARLHPMFREGILPFVYGVLAFLSSIPFFARHPLGGIIGPLGYGALLCLVLFAVTWDVLQKLGRSLLLSGAALALLLVANLALFPATRLVERP